jgi:ABC-type lipoprotein release transport system permease subunit
MALILILSVFNGFENLVLGLFNSFNPDIRIEAEQGKVFNANDLPAAKFSQLDGVASVMPVVEENALVKYRDKQHIVRLKGVGEGFLETSPVPEFIISGEPLIRQGESNFSLLGAGVAYYLSYYKADFNPPLNIYLPKRTRKGYTGVSPDAFNRESIAVSGVFQIQQEVDSRYVLLPIGIARQLLEYTDEVTHYEIMLKEGAYSDQIQEEIAAIAGEGFTVKNRLQQQALLYRVLNSEKWATFLILAFILVIATFNVIGSLSILIIDKKKDIAVLWSLGANRSLIRSIFIFEGMMISVFGGILGLLLGGLIAWLQQTFGFITLGGDEGSYIVDAYPVIVKASDFLWVLLTVLAIGGITVWIPVRQISKKYLGPDLHSFLMR